MANEDGVAGGATFDEVLESIVNEQPLEETFNLIARRAAAFSGFDFCGILLSDAAGKRLRLAGAHKFPASYQEQLDGILRAPFEDASFAGSPTARALRERRVVVLRDTLTDPSYRPWRKFAEAYGFRSVVSVPLITRGEAVGTLNGYSMQPSQIADGELAAMERLANQAALALRLTLLVEGQHRTIAQLRQSNDQLETQRSVLERAHQIHLRLTDAVMAGADFQSVAQILAGLVGRPSAVVDAHGALLATSEPPPDVDLAAVFAAQLEPLEAPSRARRGRGAHHEPARQEPAGRVLVGPIHIGSEALGHVLVEEGQETSRDLDVRAIEHAATVLAVHIAKERVARATEERLSSEFLLDLLTGRDSPQRLAERAEHYGLALANEHHVLVAAISPGPQHPATDESTLAEAERRGALARRVLAETLREQLPGTLLGGTGDDITAVIPTAGLPDAPAALHSALGDCRRRIEQLAPGVRLSVGIGSAAQHPAAFIVSHREAHQCVDALRRLDREGETIATSELGVLGLFLDSNRPEQLVALGRNVLGPALDRDAERGSALVSTLETYFDHSCDVQACARELFIHPNTVKYRLGRLEALCGLDLRDPDDLLKATIARLSLRLLSATAR